jgi:hypothetical protein
MPRARRFLLVAPSEMSTGERRQNMVQELNAAERLGHS